MTPAGFVRLAWQTVTAPREVAQLLIAARLSHEAILTAMALVVALNALVMGILQVSMGAGALPFVMSPVLFGALLAAMLVVSVMVLTGVGRMLGGTARAEDLAVLLAWLQAVRILWQVIVAVAALLTPALASILAVLGFLAGIYIFLNFLDVAHGFGNLLRALAVLVIGGLVLVMAMSLLVSLMGISPNAMAI
ncbi:YIP1 family protein [Salipiger bermudensis]|uniref:YIP1 family protein n=1 Tax=Salipiger bermudensis TaxID=344736 RepID=UPI001A8D6D69|nr:YIP1 family protein [Salipiger bermudensis]MBN9677638.1 YIP1 family protein [Salipiger bermudensis]MBR9892802.1 YIP1 family protein [bacterium]